MRYNIMGIVFMLVAIWLGTLLGSMIAGMIGFAGGIIGSIIVGFIIYLVWALISGTKRNLMHGLIFAALVYIAQLISGVIFTRTGFGGGLIGYAVTAVLVSFLWGWIGKGTAKTSGISMGKAGTGKRRRRR